MTKNKYRSAGKIAEKKGLSKDGIRAPDEEIKPYKKPKPPKTNKRVKVIIQYSRNGLMPLREWSSANEIERTYGMDRWSILCCCKGKTKTSYKFVWRFKEDLAKHIQEDLDNKLNKETKEYNNINESDNQ